MASSDEQSVTVEHYLRLVDESRPDLSGRVAQASPGSVRDRDRDSSVGALAGYEALGRRIVAVEWERDQYRESLHAMTREVERVEGERARYGEALAMAVRDLRDTRTRYDLVDGECLRLRETLASWAGLIDTIRTMTDRQVVRDLPHFSAAKSLLRQVQRTIRAGHKADAQ